MITDVSGELFQSTFAGAIYAFERISCEIRTESAFHTGGSPATEAVSATRKIRAERPRAARYFMAPDYFGRWNTSEISAIWLRLMPSGSKPIARALM